MKATLPDWLSVTFSRLHFTPLGAAIAALDKDVRKRIYAIVVALEGKQEDSDFMRDIAKKSVAHKQIRVREIFHAILNLI